MVSDKAKRPMKGSHGSRLNPCFNGIWSRTAAEVGKLQGRSVLILVLMEYGLGLVFVLQLMTISKDVLILVLMEYGLGLLESKIAVETAMS